MYYFSLYRSLQRLIAKYVLTNSVADRIRCKRKSRLDNLHEKFIDDALADNDELTAYQIKQLLVEKWPNLATVSIPTIKRCRKRLGWVASTPRYCQLIREANKSKRLDWCWQCINNDDHFENVIFSDECTVALEKHGKLTFRRLHQPRKLKPRPKHPVKIHIWAAISCRGASSVVLFSGIMNATRYTTILEAGLLPLINDKFSTGSHRFQQDNDPKHTSHYAQEYLRSKNINWWKTPPESPDLNPIENVWGSLKQFLRKEYKPQNLDDLKCGIRLFWRRMTPSVCQNYIAHVQKVMIKVIEVNGEPSGY